MLYGSIKALYYALLKQQRNERLMSRAEHEMVGEVLNLDLEDQQRA